MYVERWGAGPRRFLGLHGWSGDHRTFAPLVPHLPSDVSLFAVDLPGIGRTPGPASRDLQAIAADLADTILDLAQPTLTLIGNCSGGLLGLEALLELATRDRAAAVERIVLIDPFAYWPWYFRVFVAPGWGRYAYFTTFANPLGRWITNAGLRSKRAPGTNLTQGFSGARHHVTWQYLKLLSAIPGCETFRHIRTPVDILHGEGTFSAVRQSARRWCEMWPQARVTELPGAGHLPILEATTLVSEAVFAAAAPGTARAAH